MEKFYELNLKEIGGRIRNARKMLNLTQEKAAEQIFITAQFWSLVESGHTRASVDTYLQIAAVLGITLNDIFYDDAANMRLHSEFSKESLLADCTAFEKAIISEIMFDLKGILKRNRIV